MNLYPFQERGVDFLLNEWRRDPLRTNAAYLADRMGLGKTIQASAAARRLQPESVLVVAKASAVLNWEREWERWGHPGADIRIRSWATVHREEEVPDLLILDEAHMAKNPDARRTRAALDLAAKSEQVYALSGTPMPNHPGELYAVISALWPEVLEELGIRGYWSWIHRFCQTTKTPFGLKVWGVKNAKDLSPYIPRIMLRRSVQDVGLQLPPARLDIELVRHLPDLDRAVEEAGMDPRRLKAAMEAENMSESGVSKLRRLLGLYKAPYVASLIREELEAGEYEKVVLLAYHREVLEVLRQSLRDFGVVGFDGSTPQGKRQEAIDAFTRDRKVRVFVGQSMAAGDSINLQVASEIVLVEPSWSPGDNAQAIKRVHRIGSDSPVRARLVAVAGTIDEAVLETVTRKTRMQMEVL